MKLPLPWMLLGFSLGFCLTVGVSIFRAARRIHMKLTFSPEIILEKVELVECDPSVQGILQEMSADLATLGFERLFYGRASGRLEWAKVEFAYLVRRPERWKTLAFCSVATKSGTRINSGTTVFTTFEDKSEIVTTNSARALSFGKRGGRKLYRLPHVRDLQVLLNVHAAIIRRDVGSRKAVLRTPGLELEEMHEDSVRTFADRRSQGWLFLDDTGRYRHTWKGALRAVIIRRWPIRSIRQFVANKRERDLRRRYGAGIPQI